MLTDDFGRREEAVLIDGSWQHRLPALDDVAGLSPWRVSSPIEDWSSKHRLAMTLSFRNHRG